MPVPDFQRLMLPALKALSAGEETRRSDIRKRVASAEGLTAEDLRKLLPSGRQTVFANRVAWAVIHMHGQPVWRTEVATPIRRMLHTGFYLSCYHPA